MRPTQGHYVEVFWTEASRYRPAPELKGGQKEHQKLLYFYILDFSTLLKRDKRAFLGLQIVKTEATKMAVVLEIFRQPGYGVTPTDLRLVGCFRSFPRTRFSPGTPETGPNRVFGRLPVAMFGIDS